MMSTEQEDNPEVSGLVKVVSDSAKMLPMVQSQLKIDKLLRIFEELTLLSGYKFFDSQDLEEHLEEQLLEGQRSGGQSSASQC